MRPELPRDGVDRGFREGAVKGIQHSFVRLSGAIVTSLLLLTTGCAEQGREDLVQYVDSVKARRAGNISPLPEFSTYETFSYGAHDLRDPFNAFEERDDETPVMAGSGLQPDANRHKEALEQYPLDTLRYVGNLERGGNNWAIVTAPDNLVYRVKAENYLGQNYGRITAITESRIDLIEIIPNGMGGWIEREAALSLTE